jgi:hypothetical protein
MNRFLCLIAAAAIALPAAAQEKPAAPKMEAPKPPAEVAGFAYFHGKWGCTGRVIGNSTIPAHPTAATATAGTDLSGFWHPWRYTERKTKANPMPFAGAGMWGYDAIQKKLVEISADNTGAYSVAMSDGWNGDAIVFEGDSQMMGQKTRARDTFTKKGPAQFTHLGELQGADGSWAKFDEETCTKAEAKPAAAKK